MKIEIKIKINNTLYIKDPEDTKLGQSIIGESISLIHKLGFDKFTFKKLALQINSNEQSIYRYFENKKQLLAYLYSWYWSWIEFNIDKEIFNISTNEEKLKKIVKVLINSFSYDHNFEHIDEEKLAQIVIRPYQGILISSEYKTFESFDSLCNKISNIIKMISSNYKMPNALAISIIKIIHEQIYLSLNHPNITEIKYHNNETYLLENFIKNIIFSVINQ